MDVLPCVQVSLTAAALLDRARAEDDARWPDAVAWERAQAQRTYAARCAVAQAQEVVEQRDLPLPTVEQGAAMDLVDAGTEVSACWRTDPETAVALVHELAAGGELGVDEILDEAVDAAAVTGLLALQEARTAPDPSTAAEFCLSAVSHIALAVTLASVDLE
ncbi:hypothetical protein AB0L54_34390 [Streptomyces sp. NPDC052196]|uniref:hypothetical protein n=1 Tax=Streptomyces sp. NPDC052196 TaxID=3156691 RepID=UPI003447A05E